MRGQAIIALSFSFVAGVIDLNEMDIAKLNIISITC